MDMTIDTHPKGGGRLRASGAHAAAATGGGRHHTADGGPTAAGGTAHGEGSATRRRILEIALALMAQRGVDGTSMRDLASAAGLNVASLYHYFPSKRDLLESVLFEQGFLPIQPPPPELDGEGEPEHESSLAQLLAGILVSMFEVQDFVRLMVGEAIRGESTARAVGLDLFASFQTSIEDWVSANRPDLVDRGGASEVARLLSAMVVGVFVQYAGGVLAEDSADLTALALRRAGEAAHILTPPE
jgi:TetR/AcrR family transcriptional regulator, cholesterol catabolism regulator